MERVVGFLPGFQSFPPAPLYYLYEFCKLWCNPESQQSQIVKTGVSIMGRHSPVTGRQDTVAEIDLGSKGHVGMGVLPCAPVVIWMRKMSLVGSWS